MSHNKVLSNGMSTKLANECHRFEVPFKDYNAVAYTNSDGKLMAWFQNNGSWVHSSYRSK